MFVTGKSRLSLGVLNCVEELVYKKQLREGGPKGRFAWRHSQMLTERHKRCLERAWSQREVKVNKKFMRRRHYLTVRKAELEEAVEGVEGTISRIRDAMFDDLGVLLHVREDTEVNAEPVRKLEELSRAQSTRLRHQALATSEMLRQLRDRWLLQAHHFGEALEAFLAA